LAGFWALAAIAGVWEWTGLVAGRGGLVFGAGVSAVVAAAVIFELGRPVTALMLIALGAFAAAILAPGERRGWAVGGVGYAGSLLLAPIVLRADKEWGLAAIIFLFAVVWMTDILGYFAGRAIGGRKLAPSISPKKTWSGAIAGTLGAMIAAGVIARIFATDMAPLLIIAFVLSVASQAGDIFESSLKRRFGAKDSGHLIPGHGGVMDRLDGFWAAALVAAVIGLSRGGLESPARALLIW
jgi:phosphatidate cytidylyltransferase